MSATWTTSFVLMDRLLSVSEGCSWMIARAVEECPGYCNRASGPWVHLPGQWLILTCQGRVPSLRFWAHGLRMLLKSLSLKMPRSGLWSVATKRLGHPRVKLRECFKPKESANASPSVGDQLISALFVDWELANINFQLSLQQNGDFWVHWHCFCRRRYLIPSLL